MDRFANGKDPPISKCGSCQQSRVSSSLIWDREDRERQNWVASAAKRCNCGTWDTHCLQCYKYFISQPHDRIFIFLNTSDTFMTLIFFLDLIVRQSFFVSWCSDAVISQVSWLKRHHLHHLFWSPPIPTAEQTGVWHGSRISWLL